MKTEVCHRSVQSIFTWQDIFILCYVTGVSNLQLRKILYYGMYCTRLNKNVVQAIE